MRVLNRARGVAEYCIHLLCRTQMPLSIDGKQPSGMIEVGMVTNCCEDIQHLSLVLCRITNSVCGQHRKSQRSGYAYRCLISPLFLTFLVALDLDINIFTPKDGDQLLDKLRSSLFSATRDRCRKGSLVASSQTDQPVRKFL